MTDRAAGEGDFAKSFKDAATSASDKFEEHAAHFGAELKDRFGPAAEKVLEFTKKRPATSLLIALAAGMLLARRR